MLNLRLGRLVQIIHVLNHADDVRRSELQWQTLTVAKTVANIARTEKQRDALLKALDQMRLVDTDEDQGAAADTSGDSRSLEDIIENGSVQQALARNMRRQGPGLTSVQWSRRS